MNIFGPPPYPLNRLYVNLQDAARELRLNFKAPDALIGMSMLSVMSAACQGLIDVKLPTGQICPVTLNFLPVGISGERKSALDHCVGKPLYEHDEKCQLAYEADVARYEQALPLWEDTKRGLRQKRIKLVQQGVSTEDVDRELDEHGKNKPVRPRLRQFIRQDITGRAIADALQGDGEAIVLTSDEGDTLLNGEALRQLGMLNRAWDGSPLVLDRAAGKKVLARHPRVTTNIMVQPFALQKFLARRGEHARGIGYLSRYLIGWPVSTQGTRHMSRREQTWSALLPFHARVSELLVEYDRRIDTGAMERTVVQFSEEAKLRWISLVNETEDLIHPQGELHDISDFASKACEIIGRVAAILHYFSSQDGDINVDMLERAIAIVGWHIDEAQRLFGAGSELSLSHGDARVLIEYLYARVWQEKYNRVRRTDLMQYGPVSLRKKKRLGPALELLAENKIVGLPPQDFQGIHYVELDGEFFSSYRPQQAI